MPIVLDATPGSATANTYADVTWADAYNIQRPFSTGWTEDADPDAKASALVQATAILDATFPWTGSATDAVQALAWPRIGMVSRNGFPIPSNVIPRELKNATAEFARQLLISDRSGDNEAVRSGIHTLRAGPVSLGWQIPQKSSSVDMRDADVIQEGPDFYWMNQVVPTVVRMLIPGSWYTRETVSQPIVFSGTR
jgi:hypothetical protein